MCESDVVPPFAHSNDVGRQAIWPVQSAQLLKYSTEQLVRKAVDHERLERSAGL